MPIASTKALCQSLRRLTADIRHYGIYGEARAQAVKLAIDWFNQYLKVAK